MKYVTKGDYKENESFEAK